MKPGGLARWEAGALPQPVQSGDPGPSTIPGTPSRPAAGQNHRPAPGRPPLGRPHSLPASLIPVLSQQCAPTVRQPRCGALGPLWEQSRGHSSHLSRGDTGRRGWGTRCSTEQEGGGGDIRTEAGTEGQLHTRGVTTAFFSAGYPSLSHSCHHLRPPPPGSPLGLPGSSLHRAAWTLCHLCCPQVPSPAAG